MCGLIGFSHQSGGRIDDATATANAMTRTITHRGPDSEGV